MKKSILLAIGFILSSYSYADIDLSKNYGGATEWGYSGFEIGSNFVSHGIKSDEITKDMDIKYAEIKNNTDILVRNLENDNRDRDKLISVDYTRFNSKKYSTNNYSILLGLSSDNDSRAGIKFNFKNGKFKEDNIKEKGYSASLFYHLDKEKYNFTIAPYIGRDELKLDKNENKEKANYYGIYGIYSRKLPYEYLGTFDYLTPSFFIDTNYLRYDFRSKEKESKNRKNNTLNSTIGLKGNNEIFIDDIKITTTLKTGYNREFLASKKYNSLDTKEKDLNKVIGEIKTTIKYNEVIDIYASYKIEKSMDTSYYERVGTVGLKIKF
ncbi:hypothetical protein [Fusobacterium polymorphum]|jgi:hypothetical protein|uniref:Autotransporter domain-containing protein n=1 Tax=Fusobacterium nucleatum subsp. polymorphum TaxID=76857 RepID=A0A2C6CHD0_FUSNP|nr:hypothetical protein [Fusobacterium polymorphum]PHI15525.1 hypothetical protein CBG56_05715 [Fusobacterium polymorphum]